MITAQETLELQISRIQETKEIYTFKCDYEALNDYLHQVAVFENLQKTCSTHLVYIENRLVAFFTTHVAIVSAENTSFGRESEVQNERVKFGAVEIRFLGVDLKEEGKGIGCFILEYIVAEILQIPEIAEVRFLILNSVKNKVEWYKKRGFRIFDERTLQDNNPTVKMYMDFRPKNVLDQYMEGVC